ncbi:MAG: hypothetical protein AAGC77_09495, partial [Pseudomonadota bacterium]
RDYKKHRHYSNPIDRESQRTYQLIAQGKTVIRAIQSIKNAGVDEQGRPHLAIARATATCAYYFSSYLRSGGRFSSNDISWRRYSTDIEIPVGSFEDLRQRGSLRIQAAMPIIPIDLRPKRGLANYHVLWEAEWEPMPPVDPYLLRRIGKSDLWLVCAAWNLTEVERAAMATRIAT